MLRPSAATIVNSSTPLQQPPTNRQNLVMQELAQPRVSIVIPVYNCERFIGRAIDSLFSQTLSNIQLIVVDDGSTDGTMSVIERFTDQRLCIVQQPNGGAWQARNTGIAHAIAPYIGQLDSDDYAAPERLERQAKFLDAHPECGMVGSSCKLVAEDGTLLREVHVPTDDAAIRRWMMKAKNPFIQSSVLIRREVLDVVGRYERTPLWDDYDLWWRILSHYPVANLPEMLVTRTHRLKSVSRISKLTHYREMLRIQAKAALRPGTSASVGIAIVLTMCAVAAHWVRGKIVSLGF